MNNFSIDFCYVFVKTVQVIYFPPKMESSRSLVDIIGTLKDHMGLVWISIRFRERPTNLYESNIYPFEKLRSLGKTCHGVYNTLLTSYFF